MLLPNLSWGFFALVQDQKGRILAKQRTDGGHLWDLPGGGADKSEHSPLQVLRRVLMEELGLTLLAVKASVGSPLPFYDQNRGVVDVAQAYLCLTRGEPQRTDAARNWRFFEHDSTVDWLITRSPGCTFVGPEKRVGRTARMLLDGIVIGQEPVMRFPAGKRIPPEYDLPESHDYHISPDGVHIVKVESVETRVWRRIDPFALRHVMERT